MRFPFAPQSSCGAPYLMPPAGACKAAVVTLANVMRKGTLCLNLPPTVFSKPTLGHHAKFTVAAGRPEWSQLKNFADNYETAGLLCDANAGFGRNLKTDALQACTSLSSLAVYFTKGYEQIPAQQLVIE